MKIRRVGAELFHTDRHDEANIRFPQFCASAKMWAIKHKRPKYVSGA